MTSTFTTGVGVSTVAEAGADVEQPVQTAPQASEISLTVAACQILNGFDLRTNTARIKARIAEAAAAGVDVIAFPEACLPGYSQESAYYDALGHEAVEAAELDIVNYIADKDMALILGTVHWDAGHLYNSLLIVDKGGEIRGRYSKTYLAESWCQSGPVLPVYMIAGVPSCFIICHDVRYPELVRLPAVAGAQICYFCSHESGLAAEYKLSAYRAMPISRATENYIFVIMANAPANPKDLSGSHGNSKIINPDGNVIEEAGHFEECLVTSTIRLSDATRMIAQKCIAQPSLLTEWLHHGVRLVTLPEYG